MHLAFVLPMLRAITRRTRLKNLAFLYIIKHPATVRALVSATSLDIFASHNTLWFVIHDLSLEKSPSVEQVGFDMFTDHQRGDRIPASLPNSSVNFIRRLSN
jgi:hypothetical protein